MTWLVEFHRREGEPAVVKVLGIDVRALVALWRRIRQSGSGQALGGQPGASVGPTDPSPREVGDARR